jgi:hypothetical protein
LIKNRERFVAFVFIGDKKLTEELLSAGLVWHSGHFILLIFGSKTPEQNGHSIDRFGWT